MSDSHSPKARLLYLTRILFENTDEDNGITLQEISALLALHGISADRKTLYSDFEELNAFGLDVIKDQQGRGVVYKLASREFELAELKLLVDSVQSSKFITEKKSRELIKKLEALASKHEAKQLQRQVIISGRVKAQNEKIFINVDAIHDAISQNRQIRFNYFQWTPKKEMKLRKDGKIYAVSPWYLVWDDENYYLIAYDGESDMIKHYRVDKMINLKIAEDARQGHDKLKELDLAAYSKGLFGMLGGEAVNVTLECDSSMAGVIIDRFGKNTPISIKDENTFIAHVDVIPSPQFLGWIIALGAVKITAPESVVQKVKELIDRGIKLYE